MSLRDKIISAKDLGSKILNIPEWGCDVEIRGMNAGHRAKILEFYNETKDEIISPKRLNELFLLVIPECLYDPNSGERIFADGDDSFKILLDKKAEVLQNILSIALDLSGMGVKSQEEAEKNF